MYVCITADHTCILKVNIMDELKIVIQVSQDSEYSQLNDFLDDNSHKLKQLSEEILLRERLLMLMLIMV